MQHAGGSAVFGDGVSRFVALPHTEGCGNSGGESIDIYTRTMVGHLVHPMVPKQQDQINQKYMNKEIVLKC